MLATKTRLFVDNRFKKSNAEWKSLAINQGQKIARSHGCFMMLESLVILMIRCRYRWYCRSLSWSALRIFDFHLNITPLHEDFS
jgi:hypothetical protein